MDETNAEPTFDEGDTATRSVAENTLSNTDVGSPVSASDENDADTLTYSLSGTDAGSFRIGRISGQIRTFASLNFESKNSYSVTVTADDGNGGTDSIDVTINIIDVNEAPVGKPIADRTLAPGVASREIDLSRYFSDPDTNDTLIYTAETPDTNFATVSMDGSTLTLERVSAGSATITVTAADRPQGNADRLTAEQIFTVTVEASTPAKVAGLTGMPGANHGEIKLDWNAAEDATSYQVQQKESGTSVWTVLPARGFSVSINNTDTKAVVSNLDPDKTYDYQVRGTNVHGEGEWSDAITGIAVRDERPDKPTGLGSRNMIGGRGIILVWTAVVGSGKYEVKTTEGPPVNPDHVEYFGPAANITGLTPGATYFFSVRTWKTYSGSRLYSLWSDPHEHGNPAPEPTRFGHQEDHTVAYMVGDISSAPNLPEGVPDAATVIKAAIEPSVADWNSEVTELSKGLKICKNGEVNSCDVRNHDGGVVTIETRAVNNGDSGDVDSEPCVESIACVLFDPFYDDHLGDLWVVFEEPAWYCRGYDMVAGTCTKRVRYYWTDESGQHETAVDEDILPPDSPTSKFAHVGRTMLHELGHTLGLPDFYSDLETELIELPHALMHRMGAQIHEEDIKQLKAIYLLHDSASH